MYERGKVMNKYPLIGVSICAVVLLILGSFTNVVGYQTVQSSNQNIISEEINQKELLFQTIVDIANNKEIQRVILKSQISKGIFPVSNTPVVTKQQVRQMYFIGMILSKVISKSKIHSLVEQYKLNNQGMQKEITAVIEKDAILKEEMMELSNLKCDCGNDKTMNWSFPVLCMLLFPLVITLIVITIVSHQVIPFIEVLMSIGLKLHCFWYLGPS